MSYTLDSTFQSEKSIDSVLSRMWKHSVISDSGVPTPFAESAIEATFYAFIIGVLEKKGFTVQIGDDGNVRAAFDGTIISITPQSKIGKYRADFLIVTHFRGLERKFIYECDGAEFHYESWSQIKRDRERDLYIESLGYEVIRIPGKQIYNNIFSCLEPLSFAIGTVAK